MLVGIQIARQAKLLSTCYPHTTSNAPYQPVSSRRFRPGTLHNACFSRRCCPALWNGTLTAKPTRPASKHAARSFGNEYGDDSDDKRGRNDNNRNSRQRDSSDKKKPPPPELSLEEITLREMLGDDYLERLEEERRTLNYEAEPPPGPGYRFPNRPRPGPNLPPPQYERPEPPRQRRPREPRQTSQDQPSEAPSQPRRPSISEFFKSQRRPRERFPRRDAQRAGQQDVDPSKVQEADIPSQRTAQPAAQPDSLRSRQQIAETPAQQDRLRSQQQAEAAAQQDRVRSQQQAENAAQQDRVKSQQQAETAAQQDRVRSQQQAESAAQQDRLKSQQQAETAAQQDRVRSQQQDAETSARPNSVTSPQQDTESSRGDRMAPTQPQAARQAGPTPPPPTTESGAMAASPGVVRDPNQYRTEPMETPPSTPPPPAADPPAKAEPQRASRDQTQYSTQQPKTPPSIPPPPATDPNADSEPQPPEAYVGPQSDRLAFDPKPPSDPPETPPETPGQSQPPPRSQSDRADSTASTPTSPATDAAVTGQFKAPPKTIEERLAALPKSSLPDVSVTGQTEKQAKAQAKRLAAIPAPKVTDPNNLVETPSTPKREVRRGPPPKPPLVDPKPRGPGPKRPILEPIPDDLSPYTEGYDEPYSRPRNERPVIAPPFLEDEDDVSRPEEEDTSQLSEALPSTPPPTPQPSPADPNAALEAESPLVPEMAMSAPEDSGFTAPTEPAPYKEEALEPSEEPTALIQTYKENLPEVAKKTTGELAEEARTQPEPEFDLYLQPIGKAARSGKFDQPLLDQPLFDQPLCLHASAYTESEISMYLQPIRKAARSGKFDQPLLDQPLLDQPLLDQPLFDQPLCLCMHQLIQSRNVDYLHGSNLHSKARLDVLKTGYHIIRLEGCEFLIATSADGKLDLNDIYVMDEASEMYAEPTMLYGSPPATAQYYQELEWADETTTDTAYDKPATRYVRKVYLIGAKQWRPRRQLDFTDVWMLDGRSRSVQKQNVEVRTPSHPELEKDMILRIGRDGTMVAEEERFAPHITDLTYYYQELIKEEIRQKEETERLLRNQGRTVAESGLDVEADEAAALDPFERMGDDFDEPDVPAIDLA